MTTKTDGGPAFPIFLNPGESYQGHAPCDGMTLRDYFAAKAMAAMVASPGYEEGEWLQEDIVIQAYQMADAMLAARENNP